MKITPWILAVLALACSCSKPSENSDGPMVIPIGTFSNHIYVNQRLGFSYPVPISFKQILRFVRGIVDVRKTSLLDVSDNANNRIQVLAINLRMDKPCVEDYLSHQQFVYSNSKGWRRIALQPAYVVVAGKRFYRVDIDEFAKQSSPFDPNVKDSYSYRSLLCTERRGVKIEWALDANSPLEREILVRTLDGVTFNDDACDKEEGKVTQLQKN